jgi:hypothetical protein
MSSLVSAVPVRGGKFGGRFSKNAVIPSMKSVRCIESCMSFSAFSLVSTSCRWASAYNCCFITANDVGEQLRAISSA